MMSSYKCILGQVYGEFSKGMDILFNIQVKALAHYYHDNIFGSSADKEVWKNEINKRINKPKEMTNIEAIKVLIGGDKITHKDYSYVKYLYLKDGLVWSDNGVCIGWDAFNIKIGYSIYQPKPIAWADLRHGDGFRFNPHGPVCYKVNVLQNEEKYYYNDATHEVKHAFGSEFYPA
jgi:hypothetical protein